MSAPIYLDYAATAPVDARVAARMAEVLALGLGNAAANHAAGRAASDVIEQARAEVAALIGASPRDIVFTSGATEANNLAITGTVAAALRGQPRAAAQVVTLSTEHKSVLEPVRALARRGAQVVILQPDHEGRLSPQALDAVLTAETRLVTLLHVNNETGVAQDLAALAEVCAARGVPLHVDASQSAGKLPLDVAGIAMLSFTAHKLGGPQGIGALYVAPEHRGYIEPLIVGGGHERGLRAGTLATHQIAGFGLACRLAHEALPEFGHRVFALRERLWRGLSDLPGALFNGHPTRHAPHILNVSFAGVEGESLFLGLPGLTLSTGSACNSASAEPSYVLRALGRDMQQAQASLRFSFGSATTEADIDNAIAAVRAQHQALWGLSPARPPLEFEQGACGVRYLGEAGAERLGAWVRIAALVEGGFVKTARAQVYGCPDTRAACQWVCQHLADQPVAAPDIGKPEQWRTIVGAPVEKLGRMLIIEDAVGALRPA
ncbi:MAG: cysteine desulfurase [Nevskiaceae bacterium]|jgi:cysteine desulfurase|nr:cysteine desulfurase [Nevskiaceae bacterium]